MGLIRVLPDRVANQIAAGEVVERPASVVKELLENSLDAAATDLRIDVESGGRRLIRVADNGTGMLRDDAMLAFERHATSKLSDVGDLLSIATLGFRGEALPSIASVSRLVLQTRTTRETTGTEVEIAGGKLLRCDEMARPPGTTIAVRDLFYNVPARRKFLRSEQTELAHIASLVTHYSLAHPDKGFELRHGVGELLSVTPVPSLRDRVFQVFGSRTMEDLIDLGVRERTLRRSPEELPAESVFRLRGFASQPNVQKLNRNSIFLFVNGRLIRDRLLMHALTSAYHNLMPGDSYPFALLFLECDPEEVDVNVHPAKTEVRFRHGTFVHDFVRDALREVLMESRPVPSLPVPASQPAVQMPYSEFSQQMMDAEFPPETPSLALHPERSPLPALPPSTAAPAVPEGPAASAVPQGTGPALRLPVPDTHGPVWSDAPMDSPQNLSALTDLRPLGQLHDSFIIAAGRDGLWIVDQHVAHERILFEQVLRQRMAGQVEVQRLLMPLVMELTAGQQIQFARIAEELESVGFEVEPFGQRTVAVQATPAGVGTADIQRVLFEILDVGESELRRLSLEDLRRAMAASIACRAAIKINTPLDMAKMTWLLSALAATDYPMACPHGRPIALRYGTREILRSFHRI